MAAEVSYQIRCPECGQWRDVAPEPDGSFVVPAHGPPCKGSGGRFAAGTGGVRAVETWVRGGHREG